MSKYIFGLGEYCDFRKFVNFLEESNVLNESLFENADTIELYKDWIKYKANNSNANYIDFLEWKRKTNRKMSSDQKGILSDWNKSSKRDAYSFLKKNTDKSLEKKEAELYFGKSFDRLNSSELRKYRAWLKVKDRGRGITLDEYIGSADGNNVRDVFGKRYKDLSTKQRNLYQYWINAKGKGDKRSLQDFVDEYEPAKKSETHDVFGKGIAELDTKERNLYQYWINAKGKGDKRSLQDFVDDYEPPKKSEIRDVFGKSVKNLNKKESLIYNKWRYEVKKGRDISLQDFYDKYEHIIDEPEDIIANKVQNVFGKKIKDLDKKELGIYSYWVQLKNKGDKRTLQDFVDSYEPYKSETHDVFGKAVAELDRKENNIYQIWLRAKRNGDKRSLQYFADTYVKGNVNNVKKVFGKPADDLNLKEKSVYNRWRYAVKRGRDISLQDFYDEQNK